MLSASERLHIMAESKFIFIIQTNNKWAQIWNAHLAAEEEAMLPRWIFLHGDPMCS